jgi:hypothetical protein
MRQGEVNFLSLSRNMALSFTPRGGTTKLVTAPFHRSGAMESIGALRWVNTKDHGRDKNGTHRRLEYAKGPVVQKVMSASAMELLRSH